MKSNLTVKLDTVLLKEARILAAERDTSISALLADYLEQAVKQRKAYDHARKRALARLRKGMDLNWSPPKSRAELYERR
jgi:Family of unknown function (DUF6364)